MTRAETTPLLSVEGLTKSFARQRGFFNKTIGFTHAVDDVSFTIARGQVLGLVGESGCGKTTLANLILKLLAPDQGRIVFNGEDITDFTPKQMNPLRRQIQVIFQDPYGSLNPRMTVGQTIDEGLRTLPGRGAVWRRQRVDELLGLVGLPPGVRDRYPHEFSGGQRQRIGIARALSVEPSFVICDEPVSALDVSIQAQIINLLMQLRGRLNLSYLFIAHDLNVVQHVSDHMAVMYLGQVMEYGPAEAIYDAPLHPYSRLLLAAAPVAEPRRRHGRDVEPSPDARTAPVESGCKFQNRCKLVEEKCRRQPIAMVTLADGRQVRCWKTSAGMRREK
jgi:oligopeptide/dipeptide ABC transporter ATP-binding protein